MKKLKFNICVIISVFFVVFSLSDINSQNNNNSNMKNRFYLGPLNFYFLNQLRDTSTHNHWYRDLNYNMMQSYCAFLDTIDSVYQSIGQKDGGFFEDISNYASAMRGVINDWNQISSDNSLIFQREKIRRPAYGQQSIYPVSYTHLTLPTNREV